MDGLPAIALAISPAWVAGWLLGIYGLFGFHAAYFTALQLAPPVEASLIVQTWPLLLILFASLLMRERLRWWHVTGGLLGLAGAATLLGAPDGSAARSLWVPLGFACAGACAVIWASYSALSRKVAEVPADMMGWICAATALLAWGCHLALEPNVWPDGRQALVLMVMGLGPVGSAFYCWDIGMKHGAVRLIASCAYLEPLLATILLLAAGYGRVRFALLVGGTCIIAGAVLAAYDRLFPARHHAGATD